MRILAFFFLFLSAFSANAQSSMRRCTLLPIVDSVGGAIGYKVYEEVELDLRKSNWCTYISNSSLIGVFSRYRENLPQFLKTKEVISTVAEKLKVGSLVLVSIKNEIKGAEIEMNVYGENGEDLFFTEKTTLSTDDIETISQTVKNWLLVYAKTIPYDAQITGILGDQITLDVGKGYPIREGQKFVIKRAVSKKKHPLLKKIVDWDTELLGDGKIFNISDNQALGQVRAMSGSSKLRQGDWVRLEEFKEETAIKAEEPREEEEPGKLGVLSLALFGSNSSVDTSTPAGNNRMNGNTYGFDFRAEGWITRQYFAALEVERSLGKLSKAGGSPSKSSVNVNNGIFKFTGGYKYLPIGFFYGPQIDIYTGYANHTFDVDYSLNDGFGKNSISGLLFGTSANVPINREYRLFVLAEFIPFPSFEDSDKIYGSAKSATAMEIELGLKYQYTARMTIDGSIETLSRKARFNGAYKEVSYKDNRLKVGVSFNF